MKKISFLVKKFNLTPNANLINSIFKTNKKCFSNDIINDLDDFNFLTGIRSKDHKNMYTYQENLKENSIPKKIFNLKRRQEYNFDTLNEIVNEFLKSQERFTNLKIIYILIDVIAYNNFFNSKIQEFIVEFLTRDEENTIYLLPSMSFYINQINNSRRIILEYPQSFFNNLERIFFDKGFLLNLRELSFISSAFIKYERFINLSFFDYLERCIIHNVENRIIKNQPWNKDSLNYIIMNMSQVCSVNFLKKLFRSIEENIDSDDYLHQEIYDLLTSLCTSGGSLTKKDEKFILFKENTSNIIKSYIKNINNSNSFNFTIMKNIYFLTLDFSDLFYDQTACLYINDNLFLPKIIEKMNYLTVDDISELLRKINKRNFTYKNLKINSQIEQLVFVNIPLISDWYQFYNFFHFIYLHNINSPLAYKYLEGKFMILVLTKKPIKCFTMITLINKLLTSFINHKIQSRFFISFLMEILEQLENMTEPFSLVNKNDLENKKEVGVEDSYELDDLSENNKV